MTGEGVTIVTHNLQGLNMKPCFIAVQLLSLCIWTQAMVVNAYPRTFTCSIATQNYSYSLY